MGAILFQFDATFTITTRIIAKMNSVILVEFGALLNVEYAMCMLIFLQIHAVSWSMILASVWCRVVYLFMLYLVDRHKHLQCYYIEAVV